MKVVSEIIKKELNEPLLESVSFDEDINIKIYHILMIDKKAIYSKVMKSVDELIHKKLEEGYFNNVELNSDDSVTDDIIKSDLYYSNAISRICYTLGLDDKTIKEIYRVGIPDKFKNGIDLSLSYYVFDSYPKTSEEEKYYKNVLVNTIVYYLIDNYPGDLHKDVKNLKAYLNKIKHVNDISTELDKLSFSKKDCQKALNMITDSICKNFIINPKVEYSEDDLLVCIKNTSYKEIISKLPLKFKQMLYTICNFRLYWLMWNLYAFVGSCLVDYELICEFNWKYDYLNDDGSIIHENLKRKYEDYSSWKSSLQKHIGDDFDKAKYPFPVLSCNWLDNNVIELRELYKSVENINLCKKFINNISDLFFFCYDLYDYIDDYLH